MCPSRTVERVTSARGRRLVANRTVWVRNNLDGSWHQGKYERTAVGGAIYLTECLFRWCLREDISLTDPNV